MDMDFDDTMGLAYLAGMAKAGNIKLLAVTVEVDGAGLPILGAAHARCVLNRSGLGGVPVAQGTLPLNVNPVPPEFRVAAEAIVEPALLGCLPGLVPSDAPQLLADSVLASPTPVTLITSGPLTDVAAALKIISAQPGGLDHIGHVYSMLGAIGIPGGLCCTTTLLASGNQEVNAWVDPGADESVLQAVGSKWSLVPINATNDVPITSSSLTALKSDRSTPEASIVASIASSPLFLVGSVDPVYYWDPLAAVAATTNQAVTFSTANAQFVTSGRDGGRIITDTTGPLIEYGTSADPSKFLQLFQAGLDQQ
jgi:inosine-uridine nucleoside N-ribohydrolase